MMVAVGREKKCRDWREISEADWTGFGCGLRLRPR